jgi:hypothetical protein
MSLKFLIAVFLVPMFFSCGSLKKDLVLKYPLDGNAKNSGKSKFNGEIFGDVKPTTNRKGEDGKALEFKGFHSYIKIPDSKLNRLGQDSLKSLSISLWFNSYGSNNQYCNWIIAKGMNQSSARTDYGLAIHNKAGKNAEKKLQWGIGASSDSCAFTQLEPLADNKWHFVVLIVEPITSHSGTKSIYINSKLYHSCTYNVKTPYEEKDLLIGAGNRPEKDGVERFFYGKIDDIQLFPRVLTIEEITKLFNQ